MATLQLKSKLCTKISQLLHIQVALCVVTHKSLLSCIFIYTYVHTHTHIYNIITHILRAQHILLGYKYVYSGPPEHFASS